MATIAAGLRNHRAADSTSVLGENFAAGIVSKNARELILMVERIGKENLTAGEQMVGAILDAQQSLAARLRLVEGSHLLRAVVARH